MTLLLILAGIAGYCQDSSLWFRTESENTEVVGYKDQSGTLRIGQRLSYLTRAHHFENVIATADSGSYQFYYLLKSGRIFGKDSVYGLEGSVDCEREGFVRAMNRKGEGLGLFNRLGKLVVPMEYNHLSPVTNGMVIALKGAEKHYWDKDDHSGCNHYSWKGGCDLLIDTANRILIDSFFDGYDLNLHTLKISDAPDPDTIRRNYKAMNGSYYSFVVSEKEFLQWFMNNLLPDLSRERLAAALYEEFQWWDSVAGWLAIPGDQVPDDIYKQILSQLGICQKDNSVCEISRDIYLVGRERDNYQEYIDNCGELKELQYPIFGVNIETGAEDITFRSHFQFLRTDYGYKLVTVSIREIL